MDSRNAWRRIGTGHTKGYNSFEYALEKTTISTMTMTTNEKWPLELRLFGTFDIRVRGESFPQLRSRKELWLLALLTLNHGREIARDWLAATFWPDNEESQGLFYLRKALSNLRKALGEEAYRLESPNIRTVRLNLDGAFADVLNFDAVTAREQSEARLIDALSLYRGPLLQDCLEEWVIPLRESRVQAYLSVLETVAGKALARGEASAACRWLRLAFATEPWRESAACALMQALAIGGDYAAIKQVYQDLCQRLQIELNTAPAPETEALFQTLGQQETRLPAPPPSPAAANPSSLRHLPVPLTDLIGRDADIRAAEGWLTRRRLLSLLGPGGVGKTRLAIAVAEAALPRFPEGVWFVDLAAVTEGAYIAGVAARALGLKEEAGQSTEKRLIEQLGVRCLLLILDNCEHLIDDCAALADRLLADCPNLRILVTSRQALGITGEQVYPVPTLAVPTPEELEGRNGLLTAEKDPGILRVYAAVELFVQRAIQVNPSWRLTRRNAAAVCQICRSLDGIPLAIELAAARIRTLTAEDISGRLNQRFRLLTSGSRTTLPRQQTLRALVDWSYDLLSDAEKALLRRLSVFSGGWTLAAAEAICADDPDDAIETFDLLSGLVEKHLAVAETKAETGTEAETIRFHLLETVRQYAADRLRESDEEANWRDRHLDYFLKRAEEAAPHLNGSEASVWLERLEQEQENFRLALTLGSGERELVLARLLYRSWVMRGYVAEGRAICDSLLRRQAEGFASTALTHVVNVAGNLAYVHSDYAAARRFYEQAAAMKNQLGDRLGEAGTLINLASVLQQEGDFAAAHAQFERSLVIQKEFGNKKGVCICLTCLGTCCDSMGQYEAAQAYFREVIPLYREIGDRAGEANVLHNLGASYVKMQNWPLARPAYTEALALNREMGITFDLALDLIGLGMINRIEGKLPEAKRCLAEALPLIMTVGSERYIAECFDESAQIASLRDAPDRAARLLGAAEVLLKGNDFHYATERSAAQTLTAELRTRLGDNRFDAEYARGYALTREEAAAMALEEVGLQA